MNARHSSTRQRELNELRELSARIGSNPMLAQASTGNTSIKLDGVLWIKKSGKWLLQAEEDDFLVPVSLTEVKRCLPENAAIPETRAQLPDSLCASIETAMHAVLPQKVVVHVHSVNTISWAVREDGPRRLADLLCGLPWQWIPYTPSGISLARKIQHTHARFPGTDVFVLGNHGLVVCGSNCYSAEQLLLEVEERLDIEPRSGPEPDYPVLRQALFGSIWALPACARVHGLATDPISRRILSGGILYPCHAIFLPGTTPVLASSLPSQERSCDQQAYAARQVFLMKDHGVVVSAYITRAEQEMLLGLANVVQRIDEFASLRYLTRSEVSDVLNGGENYRRVTDTNYRVSLRKSAEQELSPK